MRSLVICSSQTIYNCISSMWSWVLHSECTHGSWLCLTNGAYMQRCGVISMYVAAIYTLCRVKWWEIYRRMRSIHSVSWHYHASSSYKEYLSWWQERVGISLWHCCMCVSTFGCPTMLCYSFLDQLLDAVTTQCWVSSIDVRFERSLRGRLTLNVR